MGERVHWSEAEAIVRAYREEHGAADVDLETLARVLGTDVAEVRRLARKRRRFIDRSGVLSAGIAVLLVAAGYLALGTAFVKANPLVASLYPKRTAPRPAPAFITRNGQILVFPKTDVAERLQAPKAPDVPRIDFDVDEPAL